ncbi:hypothetical protein B0H17DRAFT_1149317 [Mycena rosella]|uniref:Uncharacterized protein n=1 Tax=Mycena rosella TaxID=1033263 RepID=A0AAD7C388_MYCRO|nr:hypothetical protein B0H17DRAFT_1149317 [Mycena rosella]
MPSLSGLLRVFVAAVSFRPLYLRTATVRAIQGRKRLMQTQIECRSLDYRATLELTFKQEDQLKLRSEIARIKLENSRLEAANRAFYQELALSNERLASVWSVGSRMKLAIVRVSKTWNQIGLKLLYEGVTLQRIGQLLAFVRALEAHDGPGDLVRKLSIGYFVPHRAAELHNQETRRIFQLGPRLTHFELKPPFLIPDLLTVLPRVSYTITYLEYNDQVQYHLIFPTLVQLSTNLQSLAICLSAYDAAGHPVVVFEKLEALRVRFVFNSAATLPEWSMPALRQLWLHTGGSFGDIHSLSHTESLLDSCGRNLIFLWLTHSTPLEAGDTIQGLLDSCPALEHLTIQGALYQVEPRLSHQLIHSLDVSCFPICDTSPTFRAGFPALRTFRTLDPTFMFSSVALPPDLPHDLDTHRELREADGATEDEDEDSPESAWITAILATDPDSDDSKDDDYVFDEEADDSGSVDDSDTDSDAASCVTVCEPSDAVRDEFYVDEDRVARLLAPSFTRSR